MSDAGIGPEATIEDSTELEIEHAIPAEPTPDLARMSVVIGRAERTVALDSTDEQLGDLVAVGVIAPIHARWIQWLRGESTPAETPITYARYAPSKLMETWQPPAPSIAGSLPEIPPRAVRVVRKGMHGAVYAYVDPSSVGVSW